MLPAITTVNLTKFITLVAGLAVSSSFKTFLLTQPMPEAKPIRVAASMIVFTSLLSDMVIFWKYFFNCNSCGKIYTKICVLSHREKDVDNHCILHHQDKVLDTLHKRLLFFLHILEERFLLFFSAQCSHFGVKMISLHTFIVFNVK